MDKCMSRTICQNYYKLKTTFINSFEKSKTTIFSYNTKKPTYDYWTNDVANNRQVPNLSNMLFLPRVSKQRSMCRKCKQIKIFKVLNCV